MKVNRIRLHKMNRNLTWKEIVRATGINKTRLLHLANNQGDAKIDEMRELGIFFKCLSIDFNQWSMEVEIEL